MLAHAMAMATLPAHNLERALTYYRERLGLTPSRQAGGGVIFEVNGSTFFMYETANAGTAQNTALSFVVGNIEAEVASLKRAGVVFEEYDFPGLKTVDSIADLGGERSAWFKDSEGNILSVSQMT